jgi:hypothetical protein
MSEQETDEQEIDLTKVHLTEKEKAVLFANAEDEVKENDPTRSQTIKTQINWWRVIGWGSVLGLLIAAITSFVMGSEVLALTFALLISIVYFRAGHVRTGDAIGSLIRENDALRKDAIDLMLLIKNVSKTQVNTVQEFKTLHRKVDELEKLVHKNDAKKKASAVPAKLPNLFNNPNLRVKPPKPTAEAPAPEKKPIKKRKDK